MLTTALCTFASALCHIFAVFKLWDQLYKEKKYIKISFGSVLLLLCPFFSSFCSIFILLNRTYISATLTSTTRCSLTFALCKVVGYVGSVGLLLATLSLSFLDKGVGTGPTATQFGLACVQTMPGLSETCLQQIELFQISCGKQT